MGEPAVYLPTQIRRLSRIVKAERRVAAATTAALEELAEIVGTQLAADGYTAVVVDNRAPEWRAALVEKIMPVIREVYEQGFYSEHRRDAVTAAAEPLGAPVGVPGGPADQYAAQYLQQVENRLVNVSDDVFRAITHQLEEGRQATFQVTGRDGITTTEVGESIPELAKRVDGLLSDGQRWRNRGVTVARTEVISANNAGAHAAAYDNAKLFGAETGSVIKEWLATSDTRTRPTHQTANHQTVLGLGNTFSVGAASMQAPGDPSAPAGEVVNCRCTVLYHYPGDPGYDELSAELGVAAPDNVVPIGAATTDRYTRDFQDEIQSYADANVSSRAAWGRTWHDYQYAGSEGYSYQNGVLRGPDSAERRKMVKQWDQVFDKLGQAAEKPLVLHRGLRGDAQTNWAETLSEAGSEFVDDGVISTTASAATARSWLSRLPRGAVDNEGSVLLEVRVPAGTQVVGGHTGTFETMLKPGTKFRVIGKGTRPSGKDNWGQDYEPEGDTVNYVIVEVVP